MLFNSFEFFVFLPIVFAIYWLLDWASLRLQNLFLLAASYLFYGWWDARFLLLIVFSSFVDFHLARELAKPDAGKRKRKWLLYSSLFVNLGLLGYFKYSNFFIDSFVDAFTFFGQRIDVTRLNVILPVGISFYTFQTLSYTIDVYRRKIEPTNDPIAFFAYVSFFPQLVAGPIERAEHFLPQFLNRRKFDYALAVDGMRQILWGLFKKVAIADTCAPYVNEVFSNYGDYGGSTLLLAAIFFAFQIYGDFSGYSDIAIGTGRLFGFRLMRNFAFPYFSRDIAEFWRRWHISLTSWFRDYVYFPLGGSRCGLSQQIRNIFIIFVVSGFWHGARWTFLFWGLLNAIFFLPLLLLQRNRIHTDTVAQGKVIPGLFDVLKMGKTFLLTLIAWIFFRSDSVVDAFAYLQQLCTASLFTKPATIAGSTKERVLLILVLIICEWLQREKAHGLEFKSERWLPSPLRWGVYYSLLYVLFSSGGTQQSFIYFQF